MTQQKTLERIKCSGCGRFVPYSQMQDGSAHFYFEPDSHKGPEVSEWTCARCVEAIDAGAYEQTAGSGE
jgi:hypothetical protein